MMTSNEAAPSTVTPTSSGSKQFSVRLARTPEDLAKATALRYNVFCVEQGYSLLIERDGKDDVSDQLLLIDEETGEVAGVARWIATTCKLGRVAVSKAYRGTGGGRILVLGLEDHLKSREGRAGVENRDKSECTINVSSQLPAISFYTRLGYEIEGEPYEDVRQHLNRDLRELVNCIGLNFC